VIAFSWRQFRTQAVIGGAGLVVLGIILLVTGPHLVSIYDTALAQCRASGGASSDCNNPVISTYSKLQVLVTALVLIVPVLIGMFWGAPLIARELETGTFRLAWTQSVSRMRWLLVKLGLVGLASAAVGGLLSLMVTWWYSPIDKVNQDRFGAAAFGLHGFVPAGYALFAFALGATTGLIFRRTLPAMAVTLVGFVVARLAVTYWLRPHYMSPASLTQKLSNANTGFSFTGPIGSAGVASVTPQPPDLPNALVSGASIVNSAGQSPTSAVVKQACPSLVSGTGGPPQPTSSHVTGGGGIFHGSASVTHVSVQAGQALTQCFSTLSTKYHEVISYQPANRFWTFQTIETGLFVVFALALAGVCAWWVRHRIT
jgi:ABC-type transport system involved in multi-copper enzyme maturation permease subunit